MKFKRFLYDSLKAYATPKVGHKEIFMQENVYDVMCYQGYIGSCLSDLNQS